MNIRHLINNYLPGLNSTTAFRQANSVGSTDRALKRLKTSSRVLRSAIGRLILAFCVGERSGRDRRGQLSMGRDHWMAHRRNISLQASSRRITWGYHRNTPWVVCYRFRVNCFSMSSASQSHLVSKWQLSKNRQIFSPLDRHEEESCRCLVHTLWTAGSVWGHAKVRGSPISLWIVCCHIDVLLHYTFEKESHSNLNTFLFKGITMQVGVLMNHIYVLMTVPCMPPYLGTSYDITILRFQLCGGLSSQQADHKAVAVIGVAAGLHGGRGGDRWGDQRSANCRWVCGRGGKFPCGGQVLLFSVHTDGVGTDMCCASGLSLILHSCHGDGWIIYYDKCIWNDILCKSTV